MSWCRLFVLRVKRSWSRSCRLPRASGRLLGLPELERPANVSSNSPAIFATTVSNQILTLTELCSYCDKVTSGLVITLCREHGVKMLHYFTPVIGYNIESSRVYISNVKPCRHTVVHIYRQCTRRLTPRYYR